MPPAQIDEKYVVFLREFTKVALRRRFDNGLEPNKVTAEFPDLPSFRFCSRSTRRAASDIEERIYKGINAVTGL